MLTGTGFSITPVVGFVRARTFVAAPDPTEVASVFEVPLEFVLEPANITSTYDERLGTRSATTSCTTAATGSGARRRAMLVELQGLHTP